MSVFWTGKFKTSLDQEMGRGRGPGTSLPRSALPHVTDKDGWVSCRPPPTCAFSSTDTEGGGCDQASLDEPHWGMKRGKDPLPIFPEGKGVSWGWGWEAWNKSAVQRAGLVAFLSFFLTSEWIISVADGDGSAEVGFFDSWALKFREEYVTSSIWKAWAAVNQISVTA